jgi:TolB-like protein
MRRWLAVVLAMAVLPVAVAQATAQEPDVRPGVAVLPFEDGGWMGLSTEDRAAMTVGLQQVLLNELSQNTNLRIVERNILRQILLEEQDLGASGRVDAATAARIGKVVGARYVVLGTFTDLAGSQPTVTGRVVSVETSEVLKAEQALGKKDELYQMLVDLAGRVTSGVDLPALPSEQREARRSRAIPPEALRLYFRAQNMQDLGRTQQAIDLYQQISQKFPAMSEAQEALRQLQSDTEL